MQAIFHELWQLRMQRNRTVQCNILNNSHPELVISSTPSLDLPFQPLFAQDNEENGLLRVASVVVFSQFGSRVPLPLFNLVLHQYGVTFLKLPQHLMNRQKVMVLVSWFTTCNKSLSLLPCFHSKKDKILKPHASAVQ